jgi:hypothetical protein
MKLHTQYDVINEHGGRSDKVIAALIVNGPDAATLREAARSGVRMREFKQALREHGAQTRKGR